MSPVLKILSLVTTILCVILLFGTFAFDGTLHKKYVTLKKDFNATRGDTSSKKSKNTSSTVSTSTSVEATSTKNLLQVYDFTESGNYLDTSATSSGVVNQDFFERLGGNYYKDKKNVYYLLQPADTCNEPIGNRAIKLPLDVESVSSADTGNSIHDDKSVFVYYVKIPEADRNSFSYVGVITNETWNKDKQTQYWYKDKNKIFVIKHIHDECYSDNFTFDTVTAFERADSVTFEYLGLDTHSQGNAYAKDKNYFYGYTGILSQTVTPLTCKADFFKECLPRILATTSPSQ